MNQILKGKISRGQVFRSLVAVCDLNIGANETPERVRELFRTSPKDFNRAMERYDQTFKEEERQVSFDFLCKSVVMFRRRCGAIYLYLGLFAKFFDKFLFALSAISRARVVALSST